MAPIQNYILTHRDQSSFHQPASYNIQRLFKKTRDRASCSFAPSKQGREMGTKQTTWYRAWGPVETRNDSFLGWHHCRVFTEPQGSTESISVRLFPPRNATVQQRIYSALFCLQRGIRIPGLRSSMPTAGIFSLLPVGHSPEHQKHSLVLEAACCCQPELLIGDSWVQWQVSF